MVIQCESPPARVFLLSPANCGGTRGTLIESSSASFPLARRLRAPAGAPLGDVFSFVSGLYFRGKLAYARRFARPPAMGPGVLVITPNAGLLDPDRLITDAVFRAFTATSVDARNPAYAEPLARSASRLDEAAGAMCEVVLLGSIASGKYVDILQPIFGERLLFPAGFVGRGDMSRGGLLLRCVAAGEELEYIPVAGAIRRGQRPPRLDPLVPGMRPPGRKSRAPH